MGWLDGQLRSVAHKAMKSSLPLLDVTIHQTGQVFDPSTGENTAATTDTAVAKCGFPDNSMAQHLGPTNLPADQRLVVLLQQPLVDAGLTVRVGDEVTIRSIRSEILQTSEDPAQATLELLVKDSGHG